MPDQLTQESFTVFVKNAEPKLSYALAAAYGPQVGKEATADAMAYGWEHWDDVKDMKNPAGYLYRVGQTAARKYQRKQALFPAVESRELPQVEPGLPSALEGLTELQRIAVVLLYAMEWSEREIADLLGVDRSTVRRHRDRGLAKLRSSLEVDAGA